MYVACKLLDYNNRRYHTSSNLDGRLFLNYQNTVKEYVPGTKQRKVCVSLKCKRNKILFFIGVI